MQQKGQLSHVHQINYLTIDTTDSHASLQVILGNVELLGAILPPKGISGEFF
jgi:hypothetical protein